MAKALKTYTVESRYELWMASEIKAESIDAALAIAKKMNVDDFVIFKKATEVIDTATLPGLGVRENGE